MNLLQWLLVSKDEQPASGPRPWPRAERRCGPIPELPEATSRAARRPLGAGAHAEADESFKAAIALGPGLRDAWYS